MTANITRPQSGDLLIARPVASAEYELMIVSDGEPVMHGARDHTIAAGLDLAQRLSVDLWLTEDHIHYLRLSTHRGPRTRTAAVAAAD